MQLLKEGKIFKDLKKNLYTTEKDKSHDHIRYQGIKVKEQR